MKLSEKKLQELKEKKISIEDLDAEYFIPENDKEKIEADNVLKLLNENICSFKEIVDKFQNIKDAEYDPSLYKLLWNKELFEELFKSGKISKDDLSYLLNGLTHYREIYELSMNNFLLCRIAESSSASFKVLVDKYIYISDLYKFLENKKVFEE